MGRKIPGRKHHGVRDPEKQRAERLKGLEKKINAPPANPDEQQVSKSLQRLAEIQAKIKSGEFGHKKPKKKPPMRFERKPGESDKKFLFRVQEECDVVKRETAFENKYRVEIKRNQQGNVEAVTKRQKDPLEVIAKEVKKERKTKKKLLDKDLQPRLTKSQKRQRKLKERKQRKLMNKMDEFDQFKDEVKFGEQVHAPPTLPRLKKFANTAVNNRPGTRDLLLKSMLNKTNNKVIDKTGKRRDLPNALRRQLDQQQAEIIEAYRTLKKTH